MSKSSANKSNSSGVNLAVYAGTFDPITLGHIDVLKRASRVFDSIHVAVASSTPKSTLFTAPERVHLVKSAVKELGKVSVDVFDGLLVNYVREIGGIAIIRGLRAVSDYEYEAQMAHINRRLNSDIETVFFVASENLSFVSSSIVKNVAENGGDVSQFVSNDVALALSQKYQKGY